MDTASLKIFATRARTDLIKEVGARLDVVLAPGSDARLEQPRQVDVLERLVAKGGRESLVERVAYTWFNRIVALRFMDANGYTGVGVVSPEAGQDSGQPEVLANAKAGSDDSSIIPDKIVAEVGALISGSRPSPNPQGEAYSLLLEAYCHHWHQHMDFMFENEADYTDLLVPASLLSAESVRDRAVKVLTKEVCQDVEVIGWLYQFYISERKDEVFAGFKKNKKAGADEIPAATQLFTPHWIVRYLVENSLGRLWMLNRPHSGLADQMDYYIAPVDEETDFLKITKPEELTVIDPACGSGHMLTYAFDLLYSIYEEEGYSPADIPGLILTHNLYGTEIDGRAGALAAFALTMKARAKQRTFFSKGVEPNICVIDPIAFTQDELDFLVTRDGDKHAEEAFWNQFTEANTLGSLIKPDPDLTTQLARHLNTLNDEGDILHADTLDRAGKVVRQADFLVRRYSVVVANPPYMGTGSMDEKLSQFVKGSYPAGKADLFASFILRCLDMCQASGRVAMITMHSWMFLSSFVNLRAAIFKGHTLESMAHLGTGAFDTIGGEVVSTAAFVIDRGTARKAAVGTYVRLVEAAGESQKAAALRAAAVGAGAAEIVYRVPNADMAALPGGAVAYWMSPTLLHAMTSSTLVGEISEPRCGMNTGENARFVRDWWEVDRQRSHYNAESTSDAHAGSWKWFPYNKGGTYRKWYGNQQSVVAFDATSYELLSKQGNRLPSRQFYFRPSISWSKVSGSSPSFRYFPRGFVFDGAGMSLFAESAPQRLTLLGLLNSNVSLAALQAIAPTLNFQSGDIARLPIPEGLDEEDVAGVVQQLVDAAKKDWDEQEISWNFAQSPLIANAASSPRLLSAVVDSFSHRQDDLVEIHRRLEEMNNMTFIDAFRMRDEVKPAVLTDEVTLLANPAYRYGSGRGAPDVLRKADAARDLVSYAVGCMFGRYSLDEPGLILADQGATLQDYLAKVPVPKFMPDADNVIPIVDGDWFEDDIVERFRLFLKAAFGEQHFEENLAFVIKSLGVKNLRDYFVKSFFKDHVQRYKKRPIYWLFSSPKGSFNALIYLHRYTPTTVSTVLNEYLRAYQTKLDVRLAFLEGQVTGAGSAKEIAQASKEAEKIRAMLIELKAYETELYQLAQQQIALDLDDGVKVNYAKLGTALRDIGINKGQQQ